MREVAKEVGVSPSTVSRALRNDPRISTATRERVRIAAQQMGYRPHPMVSALMALRQRGGEESATSTIALVTDYHAAEPWGAKDVCRWEYAGMQARATELGYRIEEFSLSAYHDRPERLQKVLHQRGIRAVLLGFERNGCQTGFGGWEGFAVAGLSSYFPDVRVDRANFNGLYNVRLALEEMRCHGYRRTALVVPEYNNEISGGYWSAAYQDWLRHLVPDDRVMAFFAPEETVELRFARWLETADPDSLIVYKLPVEGWLRTWGYKVPEDIGIAYLYRTEEERRSAAGIDGNLDLVGEAAVELVVSRLLTHQLGLPQTPKQVLIEGNWRRGQTVQKSLDPRPD